MGPISMRRLLVNDTLSVGGEVTFWNLLKEWFGMEFLGGEYGALAQRVDGLSDGATLIVRNASYFQPMECSKTIPTISLLQDIFPEGPMREIQDKVVRSSSVTVFNSWYTSHHYSIAAKYAVTAESARVIPLPIDFSLFEPGNPMGLQQALSLPDHCVCWVGACQGAAGHVKGWDIFQQIVRQNPDIPFVAVLKDGFPDGFPPNMRCYVKIPQEELVKVIGACRVGLCTSRMESQHLAGIEIGACGLPLVVPNVGTYWNRADWPGATVLDANSAAYTKAIRDLLTGTNIPAKEIRAYWEKEFSREVIRQQWESLIAEVECSGPS